VLITLFSRRCSQSIKDLYYLYNIRNLDVLELNLSLIQVLQKLYKVRNLKIKIVWKTHRRKSLRSAPKVRQRTCKMPNNGTKNRVSGVSVDRSKIELTKFRIPHLACVLVNMELKKPFSLH
jgi:hypothetical protein